MMGVFCIAGIGVGVCDQPATIARPPKHIYTKLKVDKWTTVVRPHLWHVLWEGSSQSVDHPTRRPVEQRARAQGIDPSEIEEIYRKRNLLQVQVTPEDVAAAALFYASDRSAKTTGSMLPVDGGLREAFPR